MRKKENDKEPCTHMEKIENDESKKCKILWKLSWTNEGQLIMLTLWWM